MTNNQGFPHTSPLAPEALLNLADSELSTRARVAHVALLLVSLLMTVAIVSLWTTEPSLPARTHAAFAALVVIGLSWTIFAVRVLRHRRVLFARHRIVAGRMAVTFTSVFTAGAFALGYATGTAASYAAAGTGFVLLLVASLVLARAHRTFARLHERRQSLVHEMGRTL